MRWQGCSDAAVVKYGVEGSSDAIAELYRRYTRLVWRAVHDGIADPHARLDVHQVVWERATRQLHKLRDGDAFAGWISQITRHAIIDHYRSRGRADIVGFDNVVDDEIESSDASPSQWAEMRGLAREVQAAMDRLSTRDAEALRLHATLELSCDEIADRLGIKNGHARVVLHRARSRLRAELASPAGQRLVPA